MKAYERLLKYAVIKTPSDESSDSTPSSACQFDLANPVSYTQLRAHETTLQRGCRLLL